MNDVKRIALKHGEVNVYDLGTIKMHAYRTNDPLSDETFVLVKGKKAVVIEQPCFKNNISELEEYIGSLNATVDGKMVAYHAAGASFLPKVKAYGTPSAIEYNTEGGGKNW